MVNDFLNFKENEYSFECHDSWYFPDVISPIVAFVLSKAETNSNISISNKLRAECKECIYRDLSQILIEPLYNLFSIYRSSKLSSINLLLLRQSEISISNIYEDFCREIVSNYRDLFESAPYLTYVLFEQAKQQIDIWVNFFDRCLNDSRNSDFIPNINEIIEIRNGHDDPHDKGRTVLIIKDISGTVCVYKSRCMAAEACLYNIIEVLSSNIEYKFKIPNIHISEGYGWMEYIRHDEVLKYEQANLYFECIGSLLCLLNTINACDMHEENIICHGEYPVIIDAETIFHPQILSLDVNKLKLNEVGLLPNCVNTSIDGYNLNFYSDVKVVHGKVIQWKNSDLMKISENSRSVIRKNVLKCSGDIITPKNHIGTILKGFNKTYKTIMSIRDKGDLYSVVRKNGTGVKVRAIIRTSEFYSQVLSVLRGKALSSIDDVTLTLRELLGDSEHLEWEISALLKGFIPVFTSLSSINTLSERQEMDGLSICFEKIRSMSFERMDREVEDIRTLLENQPKSKYADGVKTVGV